MGKKMRIEMKYKDGTTKQADVPERAIMDAGVLMYDGIPFVYVSSPVFRTPLFEETIVYHVNSHEVETELDD